MKSSFLTIGVLLLLGLALDVSRVAAQEPMNPHQVLEQASVHNRYTFLIFYREDSAATRAMAQSVNGTIAQRPGAASATYVLTSDPGNRPLVDRFGLGRAPMPLTVAIAPNGAMTGIFPTKVTDEQLAGSFVTPSMAGCMKAMQSGKLVLLCVQNSPVDVLPQGVRDFQADPQFATRVAVVPLPVAEPSEAPLLKELQIDVQQPGHATTVFMAPPGVLVGKFSASTSKDELATALHKAGKCCDDPHCKHNKLAPAKK